MSTGLVALSSAAVVAIYGAGFLRTKAAADRFEEDEAKRAGARPLLPSSATPSVADPLGATPAGAVLAPPPLSGLAAAAASNAPQVTLALPTTPVDRSVRPVSTPAPAPATVAAAPVAPAAAATTATPAPPASSATAVPASATPPPSTAAAASTPPTPDPAPAPAAPSTGAVPSHAFKDGTYTGWGSCRHGDIQTTVVVTGGRIQSAEISQCLTRYNCSWIAPLPPQVLTRQSVNIDYVSGATDSANAYYNALVDALTKALK